MNFNLARLNMVQQQVRPWNVSDQTILDLLGAVPREKFVLKEFEQLAFSDTFIPIGADQVTLPPKLIGRILQALQLEKYESVLEIGTGTGYMAALLSHLAKDVKSIEIIPDLAQKAERLLKSLDIHNVHIQTGYGVYGLQEYAPYDVIILTGSLPYLPDYLKGQLKVNGRLFAVIGQAPVMSAVLLTRNADDWSQEILFETSIPELVNDLQLQFHF